ncbi:phosphotransferase family protein [Ktedonospora formicarum]|uniref:Aminoglycoside phosphotransferase domain-containing protein n=1 Tax=Ktedonospora formicarum TaxID=2778364 RepID=A0A8J3I1N3_9CHLR|nr:phosphotransferase [Ktedonospora formicarum]GHO44602.1 hypothetical protein KSX_27650 [Ktedonospora formicarum]
MRIRDLELQGLFRALNVQEPVLLGEGSESQTYYYTDGKVIRVCKSVNDGTMQYLEALRATYLLLSSEHLPFALPQIESIEQYEGLVYLIEKRLAGRPIADIYGQFDASQRLTLLRNYLDALSAFARVKLPTLRYGPVLPGDDAMYDDWQDFIREIAPRKLAHSRADLQVDGIDVSDVLARFNQDLNTLPRQPERCFVHGDYFFGNVLANERQEISAVLDVSPWSAVGDHMMDIAGAIMFLDLYNFVTLRERQHFTRLAVQRYGESVLTSVHVYRVYYSLLLSDCKLLDPIAYRWSLANLRRYMSGESEEFEVI